MNIRPFRWYGGKLRVVNTLSLLIPTHDSYYEPFMGSATLLFNHLRSKKEVINDCDAGLVCFMRTLADEEKGKELIKHLKSLTFADDTFHKNIFKQTKEHEKNNFVGLSDIECSVAYFIIVSQSYNATKRGFGGKVYENTYNYQINLRRHIDLIHNRLKGVEILEEDGIDLLGNIVNNENAFAFVDPPYRHDLRGKGATNVYKGELPLEEQKRLLETIRHAKCKIILCGYKAEAGVDLYDEYLLPYGWHCYKLAELTKGCQNKKKKDKGIEFIWVNYELPPIAKYVISMKEYRSC